MISDDLVKNIRNERYSVELERAMTALLMDIKQLLQEHFEKDSVDDPKPEKTSFLRRIFKR